MGQEHLDGDGFLAILTKLGPIFCDQVEIVTETAINQDGEANGTDTLERKGTNLYKSAIFMNVSVINRIWGY